MGLSCCGRHSSSGNLAVQCGPGAACGLLVLGNAMLRGAKLVLVPADLGWLAPSAIADNLSDFFFSQHLYQTRPRLLSPKCQRFRSLHSTSSYKHEVREHSPVLLSPLFSISDVSRIRLYVYSGVCSKRTKTSSGVTLTELVAPVTISRPRN